MRVAGTTALVTCANRGIGKAMVGEALRGAKRVYAGARQSPPKSARRCPETDP
jgi:NAD(P)-dependent dehydrogenase (short-subunit alcohol dehydrogenase family)